MIFNANGETFHYFNEDEFVRLGNICRFRRMS